jgi:hypothetical protein
MISATGGEISETTLDGLIYKVHVFKQSSVFEVAEALETDSLNYIVVAGGGAGGYGNIPNVANGYGGGGGAGGLLQGSMSTTGNETYPIIIGGGGESNLDRTTRGGSGNNSTFASLIATGGGGGGAGEINSIVRTGGPGGSGGGGVPSGNLGGTGIQGQGNNGGTGGGTNQYAGGGGGAAQAGGPGTSRAGFGGNGIETLILRVSTYFAGGGGGGAGGSGSLERFGIGGLGGGGNGGWALGQAQNALQNTGGGGGGAYRTSELPLGTAGSGGSGIVILYYVIGIELTLRVNTPSISVSKYDEDVNFKPIEPLVGENHTYSISPALPTGMQFNTTTGFITGVPNQRVVLKEYTVTITGEVDGLVSTNSATFLLTTSTAYLSAIDLVVNSTLSIQVKNSIPDEERINSEINPSSTRILVDDLATEKNLRQGVVNTVTVYSGNTNFNSASQLTSTRIDHSFENYVSLNNNLKTIYGTAVVGVTDFIIDEEEYTTPGTYTWTVPQGVTSINAIAVGGGGGGSQKSSGGSGGAGGSLSYVNNITVVPGEEYTVVVGNGGTTGGLIGNTGGSTYLINNTTQEVVLLASGGPGGDAVIWNTGNTAFEIIDEDPIVINLSAFDPNGGVITYTVSEGSLPAGVTLISDLGILTYTTQNITQTTVHPAFTISASASGQTITRTVILTILYFPPLIRYQMTWSSTSAGLMFWDFGRTPNGIGFSITDLDGLNYTRINWPPHNSSGTVFIRVQDGTGTVLTQPTIQFNYTNIIYPQQSGGFQSAGDFIQLIGDRSAIGDYFFSALNGETRIATLSLTDNFSKPPTILGSQQSFTTPGTYTWVAPLDVTSVSVVCIGGGGAGGAAYWSGGGGGGGGLGWKNNIAVTPGQSYTVVVGAGGIGITAESGGTGSAGGDSYFIDTLTVRGGGGGGGIGTSTFTNAAYAGGGGGSFTGDGGGVGGTGGTSNNDTAGGGGGAGGYSGNGGGPGANGSGGGGGGGSNGGANSAAGATASGGGVGIFGQGSNGAGGNPGQGGSGGTAGSISGTVGGSENTGGLFGGGGGGQSNDSQNTPGCNGGNGAVRIIWPGTRRQFPTTRTANEQQ